jgi:hypothetical protein
VCERVGPEGEVEKAGASEKIHVQSRARLRKPSYSLSKTIEEAPFEDLWISYNNA